MVFPIVVFISIGQRLQCQKYFAASHSEQGGMPWVLLYYVHLLPAPGAYCDDLEIRHTALDTPFEVRV